ILQGADGPIALQCRVHVLGLRRPRALESRKVGQEFAELDHQFLGALSGRDILIGWAPSLLPFSCSLICSMIVCAAAPKPAARVSFHPKVSAKARERNRYRSGWLSISQLVVFVSLSAGILR